MVTVKDVTNRHLQSVLYSIAKTRYLANFNQPHRMLLVSASTVTQSLTQCECLFLYLTVSKFSVTASRVSMAQSPSGPVSENTDVTFTCVTDEAEPTANVVWSVDGNTRSSDSDSAEEGMYNTQKRRSVLTVRVDRTLNNKKVECYVSKNTQATDPVILDVRCECGIKFSLGHHALYFLQMNLPTEPLSGHF